MRADINEDRPTSILITQFPRVRIVGTYQNILDETINVDGIYDSQTRVFQNTS